MNREQLQSILDRVREATGADRELDFRIHIAVVDDVVWPVRDRLGRVTNPDYRMSDYLRDYSSVINSDDQDFDFPRYTASIDAALALTERVLPGWVVADLSQNSRRAGDPWGCKLAIYYGSTPSKNMEAASGYDFPTAPLAILAATLSALIASEPKS